MKSGPAKAHNIENTTLKTLSNRLARDNLLSILNMHCNMKCQDSQRSKKNPKVHDTISIPRCNEYNHQTKLEDPFLFYSNPENLRRALNFQPVDYSTDGASYRNTQNIVRKTRISFEKDPLALLMENDFFLAEE